jgi:hypothetical protein
MRNLLECHEVHGPETGEGAWIVQQPEEGWGRNVRCGKIGEIHAWFSVAMHLCIHIARIDHEDADAAVLQLGGEDA